MSCRRRQEKLAVLLAQTRGSGRRRVLRTRQEHVRRARRWVLVLVVGVAATGLLGVLHEFL